MSQTIDQKVVELRFDNTQFEKAIGETQKTLKNFKSDLNFDKDSSNFGKLGEAADTVKLKFSALETVAITAIANITTKALNSAERIVKSLSVDNISAGWQKYADKTSAVQTIMAAVSDKIEDEGERMEYVNEQIERLNWFTDETSYNLVDMTSNIGKFVAAGVDLPKAVDAMQGIATWAALSGANAQTASHAMGQLAQAMGTGSVRLQDWASIENANMATKEFKEMAIDTARRLGTLMVDNDGITFAPNTRKGTDVNAENFRSTLAEGWFTSDVLEEVLERYGKFATNLNALSESMLEDEEETTSTLIKYIEDYKDEANGLSKDEILQRYAEKTGRSIEDLRKQFDELASDELGLKAFKAAQEAKTFAEAIQSVKDAVSTGWMNTFEKVFGTYDKARVLWTDLANDLWEVFNGGAEERNNILNKWIEGGGQEHVHDIIIGLTHLIIDFKEAWKEAIKLVFGESTQQEKANKLLEFTQKIRDFIKSLALFNRDEHDEIVGLTKRGERVVEIFKTFLSIIKPVATILTTSFKVAWKVVKSVWKAITILFDGIRSFASGFKSFFGVKKLSADSQAALDTLKGVGDKAEKKLSIFERIGNKLKEWSEKFDKSKFLNSMKDWGFKFASFLDDAWRYLKKVPSRINTWFKDVFGIGVDDLIKKLWDDIKSFFNWLKEQKIFVQIWDGVKDFFSKFSGWLKVTFNAENIKGIIEKVREKFIKAFEWVKELFSKKKNKNGQDSIVSGASSTSAVAEKGTKTAADKWKKVAEVLSTVFDVIGSALRFVKNFLDAFDFKSIFKKIGEALGLIFTGFVEIVKKIDFKTLLTVSGAILVFLKEIQLAAIAIGFMYIAGAVSDMAVAAKRMASAQKWKAIASVIKNLTILIAAIAVVIFVLGKTMTTDQLVKGTAAVVAIMAAITVMMIVLYKSFEGTQFKSYADVLMKQVAFAGLMTAMTAFLVSLSVLVLAFAYAVKQIASIEDMTRMEIAAGLVIGLIVAVFALAIAMVAVIRKMESSKIKAGDFKSTTKSSAKMTLAALALFMLSLSKVITTLTDAIVKLASVNQNDMLVAAAVVTALLSVMAIMVVAIMALVQDTHKGSVGALLSASVLLLAMGAVLQSIVFSITTLAGVAAINNKTTAAFGMVIAILATMAILMVALIAISRIGHPTAILSSAVLFLAMGIVVRALVGAISYLAFAIKRYGADAVTSAMWKLVAILAVASAVVAGIMLLSQFSYVGPILSAALLFVAIGVAVNSLISNVIRMAIIVSKYGTAAEKAFKMVAVLVLELGVIVAALLALSKTTTNPMPILAVSVALIAIALALRIMVPVIQELAKQKLTDILKIAVGIIAIIGAFAIGGSLASRAIPGILAISAMMLAFAVLLFAVSTAVDICAKSLSAFADGIVYFSKTIVKNRTDIVAAAGAIGNAISVAFEAILIGALTAFAKFLAALATISGQIFESLTIIAENGLNFLESLAEPTVKVAEKMIKSVLESLIRLAPTFGLFLYEFLHAVLQATIKLLPDIIELVVELVTQLLEKLAENAYRLGTAIVKFVVGLIDALSDNMKDLIDSLVNFWESFFNAMIGNVGRIVRPATKFLGELIGELAKGLDEDLLKPISDAIISVIETILGAPIAGVMGSLGMGLSEFAIQASDFFDAIGKLDPGAMSALSALSSFMLAITAKEVTDGIAALFTGGLSLIGDAIGGGPLAKFGKELVKFADPLIEFSEKVDGRINADTVENVGIAAQSLAALYPLMPREGGGLQAVFGEVKKLGTFGEELKTFGEQFALFYPSIARLNVDKEIVETVGNAAETMAALYPLMPREGGGLQKVIGEVKKLGTFGKELGDFGNEFKKFYQSIATLKINKDLVDTVDTIAQTFAGLYPLMPLTGGKLQQIIGEVQSLGAFGADMANFADGFMQFSDKLSSETYAYNGERLKAITPIVETFAGLYSHLRVVGGMINWLAGKRSSLKEFGQDMSNFADGFRNFSNKLSGDDFAFDEEKLDAITRITDAFVTFYDKLIGNNLVDELIRWVQAITKTDPLTTFGDQMGRLANSLKNFVNTISANATANNTGLEHVKEYFQVLQDVLDFAKDANENTYVLDGVKNSISSFLDDINARALSSEKYKTNMKLSGEDLAKAFFTGFSDVFSSAEKAFGESGNNATQQALAKLFGTSDDSPWVKFGKKLEEYFKTGEGYRRANNAASNFMTVGFIPALKREFNSQVTQLGVANPGPNQLPGRLNAFLDALASHTTLYVQGLAFQTALSFTGYWIVQGIIDSIDLNLPRAKAAGARIADSIREGVEGRNGMYIESPSHVMYQDGIYVIQGFVNGINDNLYTVKDSGESIAETALDGFQRAMLTANDYITDAMDGPLTLTPVLDLSEIQNGTAQLSQMMSSVDGYQLDGSARFASDAYMSRHSNEPALQSASVDRLTNAIEDLIQNPQNNLTNTFNINGTNAHEIAEEVSRILQMQVDRRQAVWG